VELTDTTEDSELLPPGPLDYDVDLPADLFAIVDELAMSLGVTSGIVFLAAHARVVSALTGKPHVCVGVTDGSTSTPRILEVSVSAYSWSELICELSEQCAERTVAADGLPAIETMVHLHELPAPAPGKPAGDFFSVGWMADRRMLRLHHEGRLNASRLCGYHLAALRAAAATPDALVRAASLLSPDEIKLQVYGHGAAARPLPDLRVHELFEERARQAPDAVAVTLRATSWTYETLNENANRVAHALLDAGLRREDVVAVVADRTLEWAAAILGIFKAGGVYMPIDPGYPPERVRTLLDQSACRYRGMASPGTAPERPCQSCLTSRSSRMCVPRKSDTRSVPSGWYPAAA
jgi:hypothetical protein